jgi:ZIP family zinc transporter
MFCTEANFSRRLEERFDPYSVFHFSIKRKNAIFAPEFMDDSMQNNNIAIPLLLTLLAGLATVAGSLIAFFSNRTNRRLLSFSLGLSAGVMIFVSFVELYAEAQATLMASAGEKTGMWVTVMSFFGGMLLIGIIDRLVPSNENPHEARALEDMKASPAKDGKLMRMGVLTSLAITIHNFPEGIATFMAAVENPTLGVAIAVAIAIHNVPEGIAVSVPVYFATGNRWKAFWISLLSGIAEPVGALIAYLFLMPFMSPFLMGCVFAIVAGIMVFISLDELLPAAHEYGEYHVAIYGLVVGMGIMAASLVLLL